MYGSRHIIKGFSLLEVMIAVFILAIGLLGLAHLQAITLKQNESAYLRSQVSALAADIFDRMRANQVAAIAGNYNHGQADEPPPVLNTIAAIDISEWLNNVSTILPDGNGSIYCNPCSAGSVYLVTLKLTELQSDGLRGTSQFDYSGAL